MVERVPAFPEIIVSRKLQLGKADGILREESGHSHFPGQVTVPACSPNAFEYVPFIPLLTRHTLQMVLTSYKEKIPSVVARVTCEERAETTGHQQAEQPPHSW